LGGRQEKAVDREQIRPPGCPSAVPGPSFNICVLCVVSPRASSFFLALLYLHLIVALKIHRNRTRPGRILIYGPVRLCRQSISFLTPVLLLVLVLVCFCPLTIDIEWAWPCEWIRFFCPIPTNGNWRPWKWFKIGLLGDKVWRY